MATATRRQRYRTSNYREDPNLGLTIDTSKIDPEVFDDPIRLLQWLSEEEEYSDEGARANTSDYKQPRQNASSRGSRATNANTTAHIPADTRPEVKYLLRQNIRCIDFRRRGGALWVIGDDDIAPAIKKLISCGMQFHYKEDGSTATRHKPAWWSKSESPEGIEESFEENSSSSQQAEPQEDTNAESMESFVAERPLKQSNSPQVMALIGILAGVSCDGRVNEEEARTVKAWLDNIDCSGDGRLIAVRDLIERCLEDDVITPEEEQEMLELFNKITSLTQDAFFAVDKVKSSSLKEYINENITCERCGAAMKLVKTRKFFLGCTQCDETRLLTPDEVDEYINDFDVTCPECGGEIHGAVSRYGIYVRCENKHNFGVDAI